MTITRKSALVPVELPNGAQVVCKHDMLPIAQRDGVWLHINTRLALCRPARGDHPAGPTVAEPYIAEIQ